VTNLETIDRLRVALDTLAAALEGGRADEVLAGESAVAAEARRLVLIDGRAFGSDAERARTLIRDTQLTLARCRALGASAVDLVATLWPDRAYGRDGRRHGLPAVSTLRSRS
jgi:hypothetical protein